jgi:KamA family protein
MRYNPYTLKNFRDIQQLKRMDRAVVSEIDAVGRVLPFKTNNYVVDELIDWDNYANDPLFAINFPVKNLLAGEDYDRIAGLIDAGAPHSVIDRAVEKIRLGLNPHPAGQLECNVPEMDGSRLNGIQHKYKETMLIFPAQGQTCHAYCTFCFRWPQFTAMNAYKMALKEAGLAARYLRRHPEITDVLFSGGDPMVMRAGRLEIYIDALLNSAGSNLRTIRIGTRSLSFWPYRYLTDKDSEKLLALFKKVTDAGIQLSVMAHVNHYREMSTDAFREAVNRIRQTGAMIRSQSPVLNHVNADPAVWAKMWVEQVNLGIVPYYMFVPRNTGAHRYFSIPLVKAYKVYRGAYSQVSGLARTVRGPIMSARPGKIKIDGIPEINGKKHMCLSFIQGRSSSWVKKPFFADYDENACWINELKPAFGERDFFFNRNKSGVKRVDGLNMNPASSPPPRLDHAIEAEYGSSKQWPLQRVAKLTEKNHPGGRPALEVPGQTFRPDRSPAGDSPGIVQRGKDGFGTGPRHQFEPGYGDGYHPPA